MCAAEVRRRADPGRRFMAGLIDGFIMFALTIVPVMGNIIGLGYVLTRDRIVFDLTGNESYKNRSVGKRAMGLTVVSLSGERVISLGVSLKRNLPLGVGNSAASLAWPLLLASGGGIQLMGEDRVRSLLMWMVVLVVIPVMVEAVVLLTDARGRRLGDRLAGTEVVVASSS